MLGLTDSLSKKKKQLAVNPLRPAVVEDVRPTVSRAVTIYGKSRDYPYMKSHVTIHIWKSAVSVAVRCSDYYVYSIIN